MVQSPFVNETIASALTYSRAVYSAAVNGCPTMGVCVPSLTFVTPEIAIFDAVRSACPSTLYTTVMPSAYLSPGVNVLFTLVSAPSLSRTKYSISLSSTAMPLRKTVTESNVYSFPTTTKGETLEESL